MNLQDYATTMAHYNRWMNEKVYAAAATLTDAQRKHEQGAFFGSIHRTLNHILLGDQAWMQRLHGETVLMTSPGQELFSDFEALRAARAETDARLLAWAQSLDLTSDAATLTFFSVTYQKQRTLSHSVVALQLFNHQTHHRGQVTTLLSQLGVDVGVTDLPWMPCLDD